MAHTMFASLGLTGPENVCAHNLFVVAAGGPRVGGPPLWATHGNSFATRLGPWRLSGDLGDKPLLCELAVDPACINDVLNARPVAAEALWRWTYLFEKAARADLVGVREPASIDPDTASALAVWGHIQ
jgi:hypothetical protein